VGIGLDGDRKPELPRRGRRDRTDRSDLHPLKRLRAGDGNEVLDCGRTRECDPRWIARENLARPSGRAFGHYGAIRLNHIDRRATASEFDRDQIAGHRRAGHEHTFSGQIVRSQSFEQTLGDILLGHTVDLYMQRFDSRRCGRTDGADLGAQGSNVP